MRHSQIILASMAAALFSSPISAAAPKVRVTTYTYKTVGKLKIHADLHRPDDDRMRPVVVWIHGGALINGHRAAVNRRMKTMLLEAGYAIFSIDYRLAPETKLPEIIKDVEDAFVWLHRNGRKLLKVDTSRIAVMGGSAGGYLTLTAGFRAKPTPTVLVAFWGYGDLIGDWYSTPSPHARHRRNKFTKKEAWKQVSGPPISDSRNRKGNGGGFYQYCRRHGTWPRAVSGWDPHKEAKKFVPFMPVRNVTKTYPPTLLIHGTKDTDVPYQQSVMMAKEFKKHSVEHRLISIKNGEHGLGGGKRSEIDAAYRSALEFVNRHMKRGS